MSWLDLSFPAVVASSFADSFTLSLVMFSPLEMVLPYSERDEEARFHGEVRDGELNLSFGKRGVRRVAN